MTTTSVDKKLEVDAPVQTVYNQWTQFEEFPVFMEGVQEVQQLGDERLHWVAEVGGEHKEWYARITRQVPDDVIAWESEGGAGVDGTVIFHSLDNQRTEVELHMAYEAEGLKEQVGGALGFLSRMVDADLKRFKTYVEQRGVEDGAWRGEIIHGANNDPSSQIKLTDTIPARREGPPDQADIANSGAMPRTSSGSELRDDFGASRHETGAQGAEMSDRFQRGREELESPIADNSSGSGLGTAADPLSPAHKSPGLPDADVSAHRKLDSEAGQH